MPNHMLQLACGDTIARSWWAWICSREATRGCAARLPMGAAAAALILVARGSGAL